MATTKPSSKKKVRVEEISYSSILDDTELNFSIYTKDSKKFHLIAPAGTIFQEEHKKKVSAIGRENFYVKTTEKDNYVTYLEDHLKSIIDNKNLPLKTKSQAVYTTSAKKVAKMLATGESIHHGEEIVDHMLNVVLSDEKAIKSLMEVGSVDYYTYTHCVDVAVFAMGFATYLDMSPEDLKNIGYSALMHDIGKSRIDETIINKNGKLTEKEFEKMMSHPIFGCEILEKHGERNPDVLSGVRHHHEKYNGNGYPYRLRGDKIPLFGQIIGITDIFSALTTKRSYKDPYTSFASLKMMQTKMHDELNQKLLKEFIKFITIQCHYEV